jgi:hypothetical protein
VKPSSYWLPTTHQQKREEDSELKKKEMELSVPQSLSLVGQVADADGDGRRKQIDVVGCGAESGKRERQTNDGRREGGKSF